MLIFTKIYGQLEVDDKQLIHFPSGLYGFESLHDFALLDAHQEPFYILQSVEKVETAFILINPYVFRPDYVLEIPDNDLEEIGSPEQDDVLVFAIVTIPSEQREMSANLQGPVIINRQGRLGRQSISLNPVWETRHLIVREMAGKG